MTAMLIMVSYFSYLTARAVSRAVKKILSHLSGGKESDLPYPQTSGESDIPTFRKLIKA